MGYFLYGSLNVFPDETLKFAVDASLMVIFFWTKNILSSYVTISSNAMLQLTVGQGLMLNV